MVKKIFNDNWLFWNSKNAFALVWSVPEDARKIDLPHDAMLETKAHADSVNGTNTGFYDGGSYTYVKNIESKPGDRARYMALQFEGVYMNTFVYVNGQLAGNCPYGYSVFTVQINHLLKEEGDNEIRVQVRNNASPNSRWYTGSGIYRDVYLLEADRVYVENDSFKITTEDCSEAEATVKLTALVVNNDLEPKQLWVNFRLDDENNNSIAEEKKLIIVNANSKAEVFSRLHVDSPRLWSAETPDLYQATVSISETGEESSNESQSSITDCVSERFGIRKLQLDAKHGLRVNGKETKLRGACIHHDSGILGAKTYEDAEYRRVKILKEAGFNAIRMSHHPAAPALVRACDSLGMYIMDEAFDMWTRTKSDYDYNLYFMDWWQRDVEAMVKKDYNHPSVILYSIGNEIPEIGTDTGSQVAAAISDLCHKLDDTRYTLASINGVFAAGDAVPQITADIAAGVAAEDDSINVNDFMTIMDKYMDQIVVHPIITNHLDKACAGTDIAGYNYMTARYSLDAKERPNRVMVGSETYPPEIATNWREVMKYPQVIGDFTWTGWDYLGEAGVGIPAYSWGEGGFGAHFPAKLAYTGDIDITGFRRPLSYYREIVFGFRKAPYIAVQNPAHYGENLIKTPWVMSDAISSWTYDGYENKPVVVEVYSAGDEVELFINDKTLGRKTLTADDKCRVIFETTYQPGTIKAVSYENGRVIGEETLTTATGKPRLVASFDSNNQEDSSLVYINLEITDANNIVYTNMDQSITVSLEGDATLLGVGSGNPKSQDDYTGCSTHTFMGRAQAIVKRNVGAKAIIRAVAEDGSRVELTI